MDSDAAFLSPVAGYGYRYLTRGVRHWIVSIENVLGLPSVADFMTYFPVYYIFTGIRLRTAESTY